MNIRLAATAGVLALASIAGADVAISTFTFSDLESEYFTQDGVTGYYTARAGVNTSGDVTRLNVPTVETAGFSPAFALDDSSFADVVFSMTVSNITALTADGSGTFSIVDLDGDSITGTLNGMWSRAFAGAPVLFFTGTLTNVNFNGNGDGVFAGTDGLGFALTDYLLNNVFSGGLVQVSFGLDSFFDESFSGFNSQFSGVIVPTPGSVALLLGASGIVARRRR